MTSTTISTRPHTAFHPALRPVIRPGFPSPARPAPRLLPTSSATTLPEQPARPTRPECTVDGCAREQVNGREHMCSAHRSRVRAHGDPGPAQITPRPTTSGHATAAHTVQAATQRAADSVPPYFPHAEQWRDYLSGNARAHLTYVLEHDADVPADIPDVA